MPAGFVLGGDPHPLSAVVRVDRHGRPVPVTHRTPTGPVVLFTGGPGVGKSVDAAAGRVRSLFGARAVRRLAKLAAQTLITSRGEQRLINAGIWSTPLLAGVTVPSMRSTPRSPGRRRIWWMPVAGWPTSTAPGC